MKHVFVELTNVIYSIIGRLQILSKNNDEMRNALRALNEALRSVEVQIQLMEDDK